MKITDIAISRTMTGGGGGGGGGGQKIIDALIDGSVTEIKSNAAALRDYSLAYCKNLEIIDFSSVQEMKGVPFQNCYSLKAVILRSESICSLGYPAMMAFSGCCHLLGSKDSTYNPEGLKDGYFYVPRSLLSDDDVTNDYRRATNWSSSASQFRILEDFTVDGTITGELDWEKVNAA